MITIVGFLLASSAVKATLIIPPADMNAMIMYSDYVVYGEVVGHIDQFGSLNSFKVEESFRGGLSPGQLIELKEYGSRSSTEMTTISGDVDYQIGSKYLLFLFKDGSGAFKSRLLSLSVFEEILNNGQRQFIHHQSILDMCFFSEVDESLLSAYRADLLRRALRSDGAFIQENSGFLGYVPHEKIKGVDPQNVKKSTCVRPSYCSTILGNVNQLSASCSLSSPAKYQNPNFIIKVASGAASDPSEPNALSHLANAVSELDGLPGITASTASPLIQTCSTNMCTEVGDVTFNTCNTNRLNDIWIYFNDPCDEVADLINCGIGGGPLGLGGTWATTPCHIDVCGDQWLTAIVPYVVINNGTGCLNNYNYTAVLIHEMLHSLNLAHIPGSCSALMNGGLCGSNSPNAPNFGITQLDKDCIEWMYNQCPVNESFTNITYPSSYNDPEFAQNQISASNILVKNGANIIYDAGVSVNLNPLFEVELGAVFSALVNGCIP